jgi:hypothetical protein
MFMHNFIYRFQNVFTVRTSRLKSYYLVRIVVAFGVVALMPLIVWYALYPIEVDNVMISSTSFCWLCTYPTATNGNWIHINAVEIVVLVWCAILTITAAFLAFKVRQPIEMIILC